MSDHLVVLVHGLWGNPDHMWCIKESLEKKHGDIHILVSKDNIGNRTYDGVDIAGERLVKEIQAELERLKRSDQEIKRISFVGYSLGGLAARYAIGILFSTGYFDQLRPVNFTTFATPHVGVCPPKKGFFSYLVSALGPRSLSVTGAQIFLADAIIKDRPLLEVMTDPESSFVKGLNAFERRALYANVENDRSVPYFTAAIDDRDPYQEMATLRLNFDRNYNVILDHEKPYSYIEAGEKSLNNIVPMTYRELTFRCVMLAGLPIWITLFLGNAIVANFRSAQRIAAHREEHGSGTSLFSSLNQRMVEDVLESGRLDANLNLNNHQTRIINNLNKVKWQKFYVRIKKTQHTHAAIVCRARETDRFTEGHEVMRHWLDQVFLA